MEPVPLRQERGDPLAGPLQLIALRPGVTLVELKSRSRMSTEDVSSLAESGISELGGQKMPQKSIVAEA